MKNKIIERLQNELEGYEKKLEKLTGEEVLREAYKYVCCESMATYFKDTELGTVPDRVIEKLVEVPEDGSLLEYLYREWLECDTDICEHVSEAVVGRLAYQTNHLASF